MIKLKITVKMYHLGSENHSGKITGIKAGFTEYGNYCYMFFLKTVRTITH